MARNKNLPKQIYVKWDGDPQYLDASDTPHGEDGDKIGIYQLVEVKTKKITQELV